MSHINDGILAVSSDMVVFMLKFNYKNIHGQLEGELRDDSAAPFASLVWKGDLQNIAPLTHTKQELPQLVYLEATNQGLLVYTDFALIFSITEMETNSDIFKVNKITNWKERTQRGWTKSYQNLLFSAVGHDGLDIYEIVGSILNLVQEVNSSFLFN